MEAFYFDANPTHGSKQNGFPFVLDERYQRLLALYKLFLLLLFNNLRTFCMRNSCPNMSEGQAMCER